MPAPWRPWVTYGGSDTIQRWERAVWPMYIPNRNVYSWLQKNDDKSSRPAFGDCRQIKSESVTRTDAQFAAWDVFHSNVPAVVTMGCWSRCPRIPSPLTLHVWEIPARNLPRCHPQAPWSHTSPTGSPCIPDIRRASAHRGPFMPTRCKRVSWMTTKGDVGCVR